MKTLLILLVSSLTAMATTGQTTSTVTIHVKGANNQSVFINGKEYTVTSKYPDNNF
jgi:VCBS repeat-containing protein